MQIHRWVDWVAAVGSVGYGLYAKNPWWIAGGVAGMAMALYNPGTRLRGKLLKQFSAGTRPGKATATGLSDTPAVEVAVATPVVSPVGKSALPYY